MEVNSMNKKLRICCVILSVLLLMNLPVNALATEISENEKNVLTE